MDTGSEIVHFLNFNAPAVTLLRRAAWVLAVAAVALSFVGSEFGLLRLKPGGAAFDAQIRPVFTGIFVVAVLISLRWEILGAVMATLAGAALIAFATNQLTASHAALVVALFTVPAVLWLIIDLNELNRQRAMFGLVATAAAAVVGYLAGFAVYDYVWGPTHPSSNVAALPDSEVQWIWSGGVTTDRAEVKVNPRVEFSEARLAVSLNRTMTDSLYVEPRDGVGHVLGFEIQDLNPDTTYYYAAEFDGQLDMVRSGQFTTFPVGPASYTVAIGSCARVGSNGAVFDAIRELDPRLYLIGGDLHYGDNGINDITRYQEVMDLTLSMPAQSALYRSTPVAYVWDDHDYGANDADGLSPSREAAMANYREYVPSYDLEAKESAIYQSFTIGRVRYILTDARSARNIDNSDNDDGPSMLGLQQKEWFKSEIVEASQSHELVVWFNPVPWVAEEADGADHWGGYAVERRELANHIADNEIDNLLMISGDAHMVAIDDGTNTNYSDSPGPAFPLLHAAALDRPGSVKGGPYSEGAMGGSGQFATLDISDDGGAIEVTIRALDWEGNTLLSHVFSTGEDR